ncbi:hypothetical protein [Nocardioides sp.]|uniref:hypothetical protein n=1 Tax=Nocardioides sp. TaxID=35761 RepID=UPI0027326C3C|nr:hypothetical protein [Nocardioides sp.]MDP3890336.1 hypothetical protein [Nocardioides sp.]
MASQLTDKQARNIARILWGARQRRAREEAEHRAEDEKAQPGKSIRSDGPPTGGDRHG